VADDQKINLELVKLNLSEVGITENVTYCSDGNIAVDVAMGLFQKAMVGNKTFPVKPIPLMLLDFQMPMKTGLQVIEHLRKFCEKNTSKIIEPKFVIVTAFVTPVFKQHLASKNIDCCLEKPIKPADLRKLLQSLNDKPGSLK